MNTYLITYDLQKPGQNYDSLLKYLANIGAVKAQLSVWLVRSNVSAEDLRNAIFQHMDANDRLLVIALTRPGAWMNLLPGASEWLKANV